MKKWLIIISLLLFGMPLFAQQLGIYSQMNNGALMYNPAFTGIERNSFLAISHRNQWLGINDAPKQQFLSFSSRVKKTWTDTVLPNALILSDESLYNPQKKAVKRSKVLPFGVGINIATDAFGPFEKFDSKLNFAFHKKLESGSNLSFGLGLGYSYLDIKLSKLWVLHLGDRIYDEYQKENSYTDYFDGNLGIALYDKTYYVGISVSQVFAQRPFTEVGDHSQFYLNNHYLLSGSYNYTLNKLWLIAPRINIFAVNGAPLSVSMGAKFRYKNVLSLGINTRLGHAVNFSAGVYLKKRFLINYLYEINAGPIINYQLGTHEIGIIYLLDNSKSIKHLW